MNKTIGLRRCPYCGAVPKLSVIDLGRDNGRGYPGEFSYAYKCERDSKGSHSLSSRSYVTIGSTKPTAAYEAALSWNEKVAEALELSKKAFERDKMVKEKLDIIEEIFKLGWGISSNIVDEDLNKYIITLKNVNSKEFIEITSDDVRISGGVMTIDELSSIVEFAKKIREYEDIGMVK